MSLTFDADLIRQARELAAITHVDEKRAWLVANGRPDAERADWGSVNAMVAGAMQAVLSSLAAGYERELSRNA